MSKQLLDQIFQLVGESTTLWNQVEELWYLIFTVLMDETDRDKTDAIYDLFHSGNRQRELIMRVAPIALRSDIAELKKSNPDHLARRDFLAAIGKYHTATNTLAGRRNAVVHTAFEAWESPTKPILATNPHKPSKLRDGDHVPYLTELIQDTTLLVLDLADLREDLIKWNQPNWTGPWPIQGSLLPRDIRKAERDRILQVVAQRKPHRPRSSRA
jgi:hypothetical protein